MKSEYRRWYRAVRMALRYKLTSVLEQPLNHSRTLDAAICAAIKRNDRRFSVDCCRTAPDFAEALRLNLRAAEWRRIDGWAHNEAARMRLA